MRSILEFTEQVVLAECVIKIQFREMNSRAEGEVLRVAVSASDREQIPEAILEACARIDADGADVEGGRILPVFAHKIEIQSGRDRPTEGFELIGGADFQCRRNEFVDSGTPCHERGGHVLHRRAKEEMIG